MISKKIFFSWEILTKNDFFLENLLKMISQKNFQNPEKQGGVIFKGGGGHL